MNRWIPRITDDSGAGMTTFSLFLVMILFLLFGMSVDLGKIYIVKVKTLYAMEDGLMAAVNQVDSVKLACGEVWIDPKRAQGMFQTVFTASAKLDRSGLPLPGNETYGGRVRLHDFRVYNAYPTYGVHGNYIDRPTVYARVTIPVDLIVFRFVQPTVNVPLWTTVGANRRGE